MKNFMEYVGKHVFVYSFDVEALRGLFVETFGVDATIR